MLSEKYGFKTIESNLGHFRQKIIMRKGSNYFIIKKGFSIFGSADICIEDENNTKYSYKEFINKLNQTYGTL